MSASPFSEGGSLYALGLIHANHGAPIRSYLLEALRNAGSNEVVQHGAALGLGIAAMATEDDELYEELKGVLFNDSAVAGEAAALAIGLVMLGSGSPKAIEEMMGYAHDTQHEKIIRGLALGARDGHVRPRGGGGRAHDHAAARHRIRSCATGDVHDRLRLRSAPAPTPRSSRLLHVAVSDVSDDVRRAAVTAIGFVLAGTPAQCPKVVKLLAESYNPHVRYGATFAVGISCAGTGLKEALDLIAADALGPDRLTSARARCSPRRWCSCRMRPRGRLARIRAPQAASRRSWATSTRTRWPSSARSSRPACSTRAGATCPISLLSKSGHKVMPAIIGIGVFTHFWFWHPLLLFVNLALTPTAAIGVNKELQMPTWRFKSNASPATFAYPPTGPIETSPRRRRRS